MATKPLRRILILFVCGLVSVAVYAPQVTAADTKKDEVVIEGEDRHPSRSSFDYADTDADSGAYPGIGTKDAPRPTGPSRFKEPELDRDTSTVSHGELETSEVTAVNEFSNLELIMIGAGILTVIAVL